MHSSLLKVLFLIVRRLILSFTKKYSLIDYDSNFIAPLVSYLMFSSNSVEMNRPSGRENSVGVTQQTLKTNIL
jgi:hypothetical protein